MKKRVAPSRANSFFAECTHLDELHPLEKRTSNHAVHLCNTDGKCEGLQVNIILFLEKNPGGHLLELGNLLGLEF